MISIADFNILEHINLESQVDIYRAVRNSDEVPVIIKSIQDLDAYSQPIINLKNEYEMLKYLESEHTLKAYDFLKHDSGYCIVMEDIGGVTLKNLIVDNKAVGIELFLDISIQLCDIIGEIHKKNVIHKDIKTNNIIIDAKNEKVQVIDFGISTRLSREERKVSAPNILEGSVHYISPEQTGRMNRSVDYRSDFYSLGVTFYELLTGRLPFESEDLLELVHFHIAKNPEPITKLNPEVPEVISDIVFKLLAKTAEDRYQTARGLKNDLQKALTEYQKDGKISSFAIGQNDIKDTFSIPQKLYGREKDTKKLMDTFAVVTDTGTSQICSISGYSGVGKSALVKEVNKPITESKGYFISGKFDQFKRNLPLSAIIQAFSAQVRMILTETPEKQDAWKESIIESLGHNGKIICDVIPELELIIGEQEEVPTLDSQENANRFYLTFFNFIKVFAKKEHPLVIFLDDVQWADSGSLELIKNLFEDTTIRYIFMIISYRNNEVPSDHPLNAVLTGLQDCTTGIELLPLELEHVQELLLDSLNRDAESIADIADVIQQKTAGNPYFISEILKQLVKDKQIFFNYDASYWEWDIEKIKYTEISENVVELLIKKIRELPDKSQELLQVASCISAEFNLYTLAKILEQKPHELADLLLELVKEDLVLPLGDGYRFKEILKSLESNEEKYLEEAAKMYYKFQHDRVQQASYELMDEAWRKQTRLKIGRELLQALSVSEIEEKIFDIAGHMNIAYDLIQSKEEQFKVIEVNFHAGKRAKSSTAYKPALEFLRKAMQYMSDRIGEFWQNEYKLTFSIFLELAEVESLNGNFQASKELIQTAVDNISSPLDQARFFRLLIIQNTLTTNYADAILALKESIQALGIEIPEDDKLEAVIGEESGKIQEKLKDREVADLLNDKEIEIPEKVMAVKLLTTSMPASYLSNPNLWTLFVLKAVNLFLNYGNLAESYGYSCYGILQGAAFGNYKYGYQFSELAVKISEKFNNKSEKTKGCNVHANLLIPWVKHIKNAEPVNREGYLSALDSGEFQHGAYCVLHIPMNSFYQSKVLSKLQNESVENLAFCRKTKNQMAVESVLAVDLIVSNLIDTDREETFFDMEGLTEVDFLAMCEKHQSFLVICIYKILKSFVYLVYEKTTEALELLKEAEELFSFIPGEYSIAEHCFYSALAHSDIYDELEGEEKEKAKLKIEENRDKLKSWSDICPENFLGKYYLIQAEWERIHDNNWQASMFYEKAINHTQENQFMQYEAVASERYAKFWLKHDNESFARSFLFKAYTRYGRWEANKKVELLKKKYPNLLKDRRREAFNFDSSKKTSLTATKSPNMTTFQTSGDLDLQSVLKSANVISSEIKLDVLLEKLISIVIENAGAQNGVLLLKNNKGLFVEATQNDESDKVVVLQGIPLQEYSSIPSSIIYFVERTKEKVVLSSARKDEKFQNDEYIQANQIKSVLCFPIIKQGELNGILYLENNLTEDAFTPERLKTVNILSSQAAIAIDNALLYANLEEKVKERTEQLALANDELEEKNKHITDSINYAQTIQKAILPSKSLIKDALEDFCILFRPKDIVSGDFFWFTKQEEYAFVAAVDCTGHGVPGAFMSMIGNSFLNQIVNEMKVFEPSKVLELLNQKVRTALKQDREDSSSRDGMDMCIARISKKDVVFSGAKRPIYVVQDGEVETVKGDRDSIGGKQKGKEKVFTDHSFSFPEDKRTVIYLTSDGFADQPNEQRKKVGSRSLTELLGNIWHLDGEKQRDELDNFLEKFKGQEQQRDDITIVGIVV
ncbi:MAG: AAA family ATPase [Spirochaetota bacterium]